MFLRVKSQVFRAASLVLGAILLLGSISAFSEIDVVVHKKDDFKNYPMTNSATTRVSTVKPVLVDYDLIARDFPEMKRRGEESEYDWKSRIDYWLIEQTAFIATKQTQQKNVNTEIRTLPETKNALRPVGYNRAHLISTGSGLMDAKGVGSEDPKQRDHGNGLATLGEMIREYLYEKLVRDIFAHSGPEAKTVGCYAVMDYGFDVVHADGSRSRAGYVLRQAHQRADGFNSSLSKYDAFEVEKTLRRYGLTSSGETFANAAKKAGKPLPESENFDYTNIQGTNSTKSIEVVDFGAYLAVDHFERKLISNYDREVFFTSASPNFIQPNKKIEAPLEQWGAPGVQDPKADRPWIWSHDLANAIAEGRADRSAAEQHVRNLLGPAEQRFNAVSTCQRVFSH